MRKYFETNENRNITFQNLLDIAKAVPTGKFIVVQTYLKKQEKSQINNLNLHLRESEKEQTKPKVSRRKEIVNIRVEIKQKLKKKTIEKINENPKSWFFEMIKL